MGAFLDRRRSFHRLDDLARRMVARHFSGAPLRYLYHRLHSLLLVEEKQKQDRQKRHELGRRHCLRPHSRLFRFQLRRSELSDPLIFARKNTPHRRLSVGQ